MSGATTLTPGARVGPYEVLGLLGEGGMGQVYRARDERLSRDVALKFVHANLAQDAERLRRFEHEAKAAGALNHPNIVAVYDTGQHDGSPYIVSELLQGETLRDRMATGALGTRKAVDYGVQITRGLAAAHEKGIVHRDLKPENLFLTKDGLVKILDFGIAKLGRPGDEKAGTDIETLSHTGTSPGTMLGTVGYMSPEQVRGLPTDHRSDLFSFGAVLFEMLTGKRAFKGTTAADTLSAILREDPTETTGTGTAVPAGLLRVVRRCLEKAPEDRFQTARDLAFALEGATTESMAPTTDAPPLPKRRRFLSLAVAAASLLAMAGLGWWGRGLAPPPPPGSFQRLTFRIGKVESAKFAPDGETIVYAASWGMSPSELFSTRATARGARPLGLRDASILAISSHEEMAVLLRPRLVTFQIFEGTLARAPLAGGTPREVLEGVLDADWSPDGNDLAVIHVVGDRYRLEYPIGRVLHETEPPTWMSSLRVSPDGRLVAFSEHPIAGDQRGGVAIVGVNQAMRRLASGFGGMHGVQWSEDGAEVWFTATRASGTSQQVHAVSRAGVERVVAEVAGALRLLAVSKRNEALVERATSWTEIRARARGTVDEVELPAADLSFLADLSDDGSTVLGTDVGEGGGPNFSFYIQRTDGSAPVWLGEGDAHALSPDGRYALAVLLHPRPQQLVVAPTGAGESRTLEPGDVVRYSRAVWDGAGRVVFAGIDAKDRERVYVQDVAGGPPRAVTDEGVTLAKIGRPVSPNGEQAAALGPDGMPALYPLGGGDPRAVPGLGELDVPICWTPDGRDLFVANYDDDAPRIERVDVATDRRRPWNGRGQALPSGLAGQERVLVTPDGESYAYSRYRAFSDLYLTSPLR